MVTVVLIGAALSVLASTAAFISIQNLRASTDDRKAADALSYAEAGVDRVMLEVTKPSVTWADLASSCVGTPGKFARSGSIGNGSYYATMTLSDSKGDPAAVCPSTSPPRYSAPQYFTITSDGTSPEATRRVRQVVKVTGAGLPVGVFAHSVTVGGNPQLYASLISDQDITGRDKLAFVGSDPYYKLSDFWPGLSATTAARTAVHSTGVVYAGNAPEHSVAQTLNCTANRTTGSSPGAAGQSQWDQSGSGGAIPGGTAACPGQSSAPPPTSKFTFDDLERVKPSDELAYLSDTQYQTLKEQAKLSGIYCLIPTSGTPSCIKGGAVWSTSLTNGISDGDVGGLPGDFVAYFDYQDPSKAMTDNLIHWKASWWSCDTGKSAFIIVRNGSFRIESPQLSGTLVVPEGRVDNQGSFVFNGAVLSKSFESNGNGTWQIDQCWINRMPGPWLQYTSHRWTEVDR
ncbi:MAG: hypothetical protein ABR529_01840 [Actinomycetota bacterium]